MNHFKRLLRIIKAHNRNKSVINIETQHQDDLPIARSLEKLLDYNIRKEIGKQRRKHIEDA